MEREANVGGILGQTADLVGSAGRAILIYVLVLGLFSGLGGLFGLASMDDNLFSVRWNDGVFDTQTAGLLGGLFGLVNMVLFVVASYVLLTSLMRAIGRPMHDGGKFWSFVLMSILASIGVLIGFALLIIPGIIVLVRWSAANGYLLSGEHGITDSLGTSWRATDGRGLSIFFAGLLLWIGLSILNGIVLGIFTGTGAVGAGSFAPGVFTSPLFAALMMVSGIVEAFGNAASFAFSIAVFHLVAPTDTSVADVFE